MDPGQFENRKKDHVRIALNPEVQTDHLSELDSVQLIHEALPELNFQDVTLAADILGSSVKCPIFVSSMTAGHEDGKKINLHLAKACESQGWMMGVGSQRRQLTDPEALLEWREIRKHAPKTLLYGNLGLSQLIQTPIDKIKSLVDSLDARGLFIHTNPLQECLQPEGTAQFKGGLKALEKVCSALSVPVVLKEVGCGFSKATLGRLHDLGLAAVDVAGIGGTHWGRVETAREQGADGVGKLFKDWGISSVQSLMFAKELKLSYQIWASGGVRSGLDAAKFFALGAAAVGIAQPVLKAALEEIASGDEVITPWMRKIEQELKISLFCTGCKDVEQLRERGPWVWKS